MSHAGHHCEQHVPRTFQLLSMNTLLRTTLLLEYIHWNQEVGYQNQHYDGDIAYLIILGTE